MQRLSTTPALGQPGSGLTFVKLLSHSRRNKRLNCIVVDIDAR
jgi:hypothetical protein